MINEIQTKLQSIDEKSLNFFFIGRKKREDVKSKSSILDKYKFHVFKVDISDKICEYLYGLTLKQLERAIKKDLQLVDYDPISESIDQLYKYQLNASFSFADVVTNQLSNKSKIKTISNISEILSNMELWAYTVAFCFPNENGEQEWIYTFRKTSAGQTVTDEKKNKFITGFFNTSNSQLEIVDGETINLDKKIDCIYVEDTFYIFQKTQFEAITGIAEEFKKVAEETAAELKELSCISGFDVIDKLIEEDPTIHKKMVRLKRTDNYKTFTKSSIPKAVKLARKYGEVLKKDKEGNLLLEDKKDVDLFIRILVDFYKKGEYSGKAYGSYGGKLLNPQSE